MARRGSKSLEVLAVLAVLFLMACAILVALFFLGVLQFQSPSDDYPQSDLILNYLDDKDEVWRPLCVSPGGEYLVAGGYKGMSWISNWNEKNRATLEIQELEFDGRVQSAAFSKDGSRIAVYLRGRAEGTIAIYDVQSRQLVSKWPNPGFQYDLKVVFSDDREVLFANPVERANRMEDFGSIIGWKISSGKLLSSIRTPNKFYLGDFGFFDGRLLIAYERSDDYKEIQIYESEKPYSDAKFVVSINAPGPAAFDSVRFSADGTRLAASTHFAQPTMVYNLPDGRLVSKLEKAYWGVMSDGFPGFAFSRSGKYLATSKSDEGATVWKLGSDKELGVLKSRRNETMDNIIFGPDDKTLITTAFRVLVIWDISGFINQEE
jgi:WD40 repeat protein